MLKFVQLVFLTGLVLSSQLTNPVWAEQTADQQFASSLGAFDSEAGDPEDDSCDCENISFTLIPKIQVSHLRTPPPIFRQGEPSNAKSNPHAARAPPELI